MGRREPLAVVRRAHGRVAVLTFDDLLAARLLSREEGADHDALLKALDELKPTESRSGLLVNLVAAGLIDWDKTVEVQGRIDAFKRRRALQLYAVILASAGLAQRDVERIARQRVRDPSELGRALVAAGLLTPTRERDLRFKARIAFDRSLVQQLRGYLEALANRPRTSSVSGVVRLPGLDATVEDNTVLSVEEMTRVSSAELPPMPEFEIPDWVDTSGENVGSVVAGHMILGRIGRGASGVVHLASESSRPDRPVALKVLRRKASEEAEGRFRRAIKASHRCAHPGLIEIYGSGETEGAPYLAMEFLDGENLAQVLEAEGRFSARRSLALARQVFAALGAAHAVGVVHRDVKPANILLSRDGKTAKLMDFGIAKIQNTSDLDDADFRTRTGQGLIGTPMYASPEQAYIRSEITPAADLYAMGLVLYEMLTGRIPFEPQANAWSYVSCHMNETPLPLAEAAPETAALPALLHELLRKLLEKKPEDRPPSTDVVTDQLDRILDDLDSSQSTGRWLFGLIGKRLRGS
jgi:hypothetical protein